MEQRKINSEEMSIPRLLRTEDFDSRLNAFIRTNLNISADKLRLKYAPVKNNDFNEWMFLDFAISQIEARKRYSGKFRNFINCDSPIIFPSLLSGEQASNEEVAKYHANIISSLNPRVSSLLDMTGGLGIDFMSMASSLYGTERRAFAIEMDDVKAAVLRHNAKRLLDIDTKIICGESISIVSEMVDMGDKFDIIFVDPARRDKDGGRLFDPKCCSPDIIGNLDLLFKISDRILIKNSPMLDISEALKIFRNVARLWIVSVRNECKEVLVEVSRNELPVSIIATDINASGYVMESDFKPSDISRNDGVSFVDAEEIKSDIFNGVGWIYEPSSSIMKIAPWGAISRRYKVKKLSPNCHVFYSREKIDNFPGRCVRLLNIVDKKARKTLKGERFNVVCRNYVERADSIMTGLKLKSSNDNFLYGVTVQNHQGKESPLLLQGVLEPI